MQGRDMRERDMYVADMDLSQGALGSSQPSMSSRMSVPAFATMSVDSPHRVASTSNGNGDSSASGGLALARVNSDLKDELVSVKQELVQSSEKVQELSMQLADKERTLQVTKADLIETRLELQRTDERLKVRKALLHKSQAHLDKHWFVRTLAWG
jgi:septal ring factor EnvC (AmiA/AmiB activator)